MNVQALVEIIVTFVREHESWAIPIAFLVAFAESFAFLSLLWPGTAILAGITALLAASGASHTILLPAVISAGLGGSLGYAMSYWIGRYFKDSIRNIWPFRSQPILIEHGENFFAKWGGWGVFFGHFFGPVRSVIPVVAGMFRMSQLPFQIANITSAFIWAAGVIAPSFFLVTFREQILDLVNQYWYVFALVIFLAAFFNAIPKPLLALPTLIIFLAVGAALILAGLDPGIAILAGTAGAISGDFYVYRRGLRHEGESLHDVWRKSWSEESADDAIAHMKRSGIRGLILSKFHTTRRSFAPLAAGNMEVPLRQFAIACISSGFLWATLLLLPFILLRLYLAT